MVWETGVQSQVESYQRLQKWYLMSPCLTLSIIRYDSRVSEAIQGKELYPPLHLGIVAIEKGVFRSPSTIKKVKLATIVEGDPKAPFSIVTTPRCRGGRYSIPWIAPLYP